MKEENISNIELKIIDVREEEKEYNNHSGFEWTCAASGITDRRAKSEAHSWV